jgi:hypothetical protein
MSRRGQGQPFGGNGLRPCSGRLGAGGSQMVQPRDRNQSEIL